MKSREGWTRGLEGPQVIKGRTYRSLVEFTRPCAACNGIFSIFVTEKIANGNADSNSFGLRNCEAHRRNKSADGETETLRSYNTTVKQEVTGLYERVKELTAENATLKARLATYELPAAMAARNNKMPWEL